MRDAAEIDALCFDDEAAFAHPPRPPRVMLCSTVSVGAVHALRARLPGDVALVDAPMSGAPVAASVVAVRRALAEAARAGIDESVLLDVLRVSSGATWFGDAFERVSWAREGYAPGNTVGILVKDVRAGIESADREADGWDAALMEALAGMSALVPAASASARDVPGREASS